ncbi:hypothetical protein CAOG_004922 [Capsaspora owczarzaki ATCC 30864]|uniref:Uncharacterized protein n=1 Tax=Capsaspora owczarzaki (strain ATCC 30864) TaxID=595528 RepID=A0A0D2WS84_CAPO3|nr:hypothetical protein CAOG_004922 [Capsaspora owczarzaki ATCC 30864]
MRFLSATSSPAAAAAIASAMEVAYGQRVSLPSLIQATPSRLPPSGSSPAGSQHSFSALGGAASTHTPAQRQQSSTPMAVSSASPFQPVAAAAQQRDARLVEQLAERAEVTRLKLELITAQVRVNELEAERAKNSNKTDHRVDTLQLRIQELEQQRRYQAGEFEELQRLHETVVNERDSLRSSKDAESDQSQTVIRNLEMQLMQAQQANPRVHQLEQAQGQIRLLQLDCEALKSELEGNRTKMEQSEWLLQEFRTKDERIRELETQLAQVRAEASHASDTQTVTVNLKEQLERMTRLTSECSRLTRENRELSVRQENAEALKEQVIDLQTRLTRQLEHDEQSQATIARQEDELAILRSQVDKLDTLLQANSSTMPSSVLPTARGETARAIAALESSLSTLTVKHAIAVEQLGGATVALKSCENAFTLLQEDYRRLEARAVEAESKLREGAASVLSLQRRLQFVKQERNNLKDMVETYSKEGPMLDKLLDKLLKGDQFERDTVSTMRYSQQQRIEQLEAQFSEAVAHMFRLEEEYAGEINRLNLACESQKNRILSVDRDNHRLSFDLELLAKEAATLRERTGQLAVQPYRTLTQPASDASAATSTDSIMIVD